MKMEIERRWLLPKMAAPLTHADFCIPTHTMMVYHWYLKCTKDFQMRVGVHVLTSRSADTPNAAYPIVFTFNMKKGEGLCRREGEFNLTCEQFNAIIGMCDKPGDPIRKKYEFYEKDGHTFEVCEVDDKFVLVEVEFDSDVAASKFDMEKYYPGAKEVSDDPTYTMKEYWRATRGETE